jgi:hypothetical protein
MKHHSNIILTLLISALLYSCTTRKAENSIDNKTITDIKSAFDNWTKSEIKKGNFFAIDSCNMGYYVMKDSLGLESVFGLSVPDDSSEIYYYYADLNEDKKKDALITFTPYQCDGGNATMWVQYQLLVLSQGDKYLVNDNYFERFKTDPGFFHLDSVGIKTVFGTYFEFTDNDGRCCPSIKQPIKINLEKNEFNYTDR